MSISNNDCCGCCWGWRESKRENQESQMLSENVSVCVYLVMWEMRECS